VIAAHGRSTRIAALVVACSLLLAALPVQRAEAGAPTDAMRDFFAAVNLVLSDPRTEDQPMERLRAVRRHVDEVFDFREAAMLALGREWSARPALEQNEFVALFADLLERSFVWRVAGKASLGGGVKVQYLSETVEGDVATVETAVTSRDGNDLRLDYRMVRRTGRWVVRDVVMEGVSTMENYHAQFQRVVRDSSWRDLMSQLRAKVGSPAIQVAATPRPAPRAGAMVAGPAVPVEVDRAIPDERRAVDRDVAAVVTPGLAGDLAALPPLRSPAVITPERRVGPAPAPVAPPPAVVVSATPATAVAATPASIVPAPGAIIPVPSTAGTTARSGRPSDGDRIPAPEPPRFEHERRGAGEAARPIRTAGPASVTPPTITAALPATPPARPPALRPVVTRAGESATAFWIQIGAYRNATMAGRIADRVKGEILVVPSPTAGEPLLRVRVGPFASRALATGRLRELQTLGYRPFIAAD
jgi:phospholipid transport system substrate-binding protein